MRRTMFSTSSVQLGGGAELPLCPKIGAAQQRRPTTISFSGLTRRNFSRTSAGEAITTLSPGDNVAHASRLPSDEFDAGAGETPALLWGGDKMVVTTACRAVMK